MYKHKRVLVATIALIVCTLTLLSVFADGWKGYDTTDAVAGKIRPVSPGGGTGSATTTYNSNCVVAGYRFTCWRSGDENRQEHYEKGYQLGHSINILVNVTNRSDYANGGGQTGKTAPRVFIEGSYQESLINKILTAQTEIENDQELGENKISAATKFSYATLHYQKPNSDSLYMNGGSTFTFSREIYRSMICPGDEVYDDVRTGLKKVPNSPIGGLTEGLAGPDDDRITNTITIHSGYYAKDNTAQSYLNQNATSGVGTQAGESNNVYTYIYGFRHNNNLGTSHAGKRLVSKGYYAICDVDNDSSNVLPFNENSWNVIGDPENSWTRNNVALIATLCGLTPVYGEEGDNETEFGVTDYVIVEPLYSVYWYLL